MQKFLLPCAVAGLLALAASPASALIIISTGSGVVPTDENVLFNNNPPSGLSVEGFTNVTNSGFTVTGGETLTRASANRLRPTDDNLDATFTFNGLTGQLLGFDLTNPLKAFTSAEFRIFGGRSTQATVTFVDTAGQVFSNTFAIPSNGFFNAVATNGELIDYFSISTNGNLDSVRQIRVGGITDIPPVPEPVGWAMMVLGFGGLGGLLRRRRADRAFA